MNNCLTESVLQAYVDGELSSDKLERVAAHLSGCTECSLAVQEIEAELEILTSALQGEILAPVPTELLQSRIYEAISEAPAISQGLKLSTFGFVRRWFAGITLSPRAVYAYAGSLALILICAVAGAILMASKNEPNNTVAEAHVPNSRPQQGDSNAPKGGDESTNVRPKDDERKESEGPKRRRPNMRRSETIPRPMTPMAAKPLPGEASYSQAIASLTEEIKANDAQTLKPSVLLRFRRSKRSWKS